MSDTSNIWFLENMNLFELLCPVKTGNMEHDPSFRRLYEKGEFIYFMNDPSNKIYFLEQGRVKIGSYSEDGREVIKAFLQPGEIFGEMALIGDHGRTDFAMAIEDQTCICMMTISDVKNLMLDNVNFSLRVTSHLGSRLMKAERKIESLLFKDARLRIIEFLEEMARDYGTPDGERTVIEDFYTHQEIANLTGTSRQTVTTILNELRNDELIDFERKRMWVNTPELVAAAG